MPKKISHWLKQLISSETLSRVIIRIAKKGAKKPILESDDLRTISLTRD